MRIFITGLSLLLCSWGWSAEAKPNDVQEERVVARVNGEAITLRQLEDELMRQEGIETIEQLLRMQLETVPWSDIKDEDMIVKVANIEVPRIVLVNRLLEKYAADVREQMIQAEMVKHALKKEKIELTDELKKQTLERMKRKHQEDQKRKGDTYVTFESLIQERYGKTPDEWLKEEAFAKLAGLYALLYRRALVTDDDIKAYYEKHLRRYSDPESYNLLVMPFGLTDDKGKMLPPATIEKRRKIAGDTYKAIKSGRRSFASMIGFHDRENKGVRGWVARDGRSDMPHVKPMPKEVMEEVFRHDYNNFPTVLGVIEAPGSLSIIEVLGYRPAKVTPLDQIKEAVKMDLVDEGFDAHMQTMLKQLNRETEVKFEGLMSVLQDRRKDLQTYLEERRKVLQSKSQGAQ